jgi:hypothetical protein
MPSFKFMDAPGAPVLVFFHLKADAAARDGDQWKEAEKGLLQAWIRSVLLPAIASLDTSRRTRQYNAVETALESQIQPKFFRIYREDLEELDQALEVATSSASNLTSLSWIFGLQKFGQRRLFCGRDVLGPQSFGFGSMFNVDLLDAVSVHLALNFACEDEDYELFWDRARIHVWMRGETICMI